MIDKSIIEKAAQLIKAGKIIAFPTDTIYGLGADATSDKAVKKVFRIKGRSINKSLSINVPNLEMAKKIAIISPLAQKLIKAFWPGALTIVLPLREKNMLSPFITAGRGTIGIRIPSHPIPIELMKNLDIPITSTSANISGYPSPLNTQMVNDQLGKKIDFIIDGGTTNLKESSTIIDMSEDVPTLIREGALALSDIEKVIGKVKI